MRFYHYVEFLPLETLVQTKRDRGLRVSLVIPALNEAATLPSILRLIRSALVEDVALLDEVIVMDGGSTDDTAELARQAGAMVYRTRDVLPGFAAADGKGTSLWKSQAVARGDILVFIDADIRDFGPHFVYGLVAPLIRHPEVQWTKAYYRRPFVWADRELEGYGGRVTEILVRPLLSAWYPQLVEIRQPLAGEYAFRRDILRHLPFTTGYGVEMQLLLQMYRRYGLDALAQVDMEVRQHRNRPVAQLGMMSFAILRTFLAFLRAEGKLGQDSLAPLEEYVQMSSSGLDRVRIVDDQLPPMSSQPSA